MNIAPWLWLVTVAVLVAILAIDILIIGRRPHEPSMRESALWISFYVSLAVLFGIGVLIFSGPQFAGEFYAGWITEYSLSVDNLFVFLVILTRFGVPRKYQQTALLIGIILALIMRAVFIAVGAAAINAFAWVFYIFGAILIYTAIQFVRNSEQEDSEYKENALIRWAKNNLPATDTYNGVKLTIVENGKRLVTPMLLVMIALGTTDLLFALDSIPAIYGLTKEPYLVFTANVFALMGLRQLYFLLGGLITRLVYLSAGLAVILGFIGVKLILHALHENNLPFINGGEPLKGVPDIGITFSLTVIIGTLVVTTVASLLKSRRTQKDEQPAKTH
ncbi:TerC family protein [Actinopolymorpha alba]|uniref:TerC family protein n=1 Tax=Actinopolymorpha alba TaxID=533267 RepID=UPI00037F58A4|nr:TerC family protein [Actinopolymorpha alba]